MYKQRPALPMARRRGSQPWPAVTYTGMPFWPTPLNSSIPSASASEGPIATSGVVSKSGAAKDWVLPGALSGSDAAPLGRLVLSTLWLCSYNKRRAAPAPPPSRGTWSSSASPASFSEPAAASKAQDSASVTPLLGAPLEGASASAAASATVGENIESKRSAAASRRLTKASLTRCAHDLGCASGSTDLCWCPNAFACVQDCDCDCGGDCCCGCGPAINGGCWSSFAGVHDSGWDHGGAIAGGCSNALACCDATASDIAETCKRASC
mmetsp:Transcript_94012/g.265468  ORF Transcript_94012/g.265468 Transcript_94012/m.265468 type:complete len:267 (+) Transcript_94012:285-1085(+)